MLPEGAMEEMFADGERVAGEWRVKLSEEVHEGSSSEWKRTTVAVDETGEVCGWFTVRRAKRRDWIAGSTEVARSENPHDQPLLSPVGEIYSVNLHPRVFSTGCASLLMRSSLALLRSESIACEEVILWVVERNARARRFYEKKGFVREEGVDQTDLKRPYPLQEVRYRRRI
jgi:ribosomal protein S18 acetylase RimI-like enzyme